MKVERINSTTFGVRKKEHVRTLGNETIKSVEGTINGKKITVYEEYTDNILMSKLHYLSDSLGNFIKLKITQFQDGKKIRTLIRKRKSGFLDELV